ncbi:hypothetical protein ACFXTO_004400 [Malus domestica]
MATAGGGEEAWASSEWQPTAHLQQTSSLMTITPSWDCFQMRRNMGSEAYAHSFLLLNSNGMDVFYRGTSLTYKVIMGVFFARPTPLGVVDQYKAFISRLDPQHAGKPGRR